MPNLVGKYSNNLFCGEFFDQSIKEHNGFALSQATKEGIGLCGTLRSIHHKYIVQFNEFHGV